MSAFDDFSNYEELFRSLRYADIVQLCRTNRNFRDICNSSRGKQIISQILENSVNQVLAVIQNIWRTSIRSILKGSSQSSISPLGDKERLQKLLRDYYETETEAAAQILIDKNYSNRFYYDLYGHFLNSKYAYTTVPIFGIKYKPRYDEFHEGVRLEATIYTTNKRINHLFPSIWK